MEIPWQEWARERGYRMACCDGAVVDEVRAEIQARRARGELADELGPAYLDGLTYLDGLDPSRVGSVIVLAVPRPVHRLVFHTANGPLETILPPTYVNYSATGERVREEIASTLLGGEHFIVPLRAPLKSIVTRAGLVSYGRNNVTYSPEFGSGQQLVGCVTEARLARGLSAEAPLPAVAPECAHCQACRKACPTGAIADDRFLLHAERCVTLWSESASPWPSWLPATAVRCLVGCLVCQQVCPLNVRRLRYESLPLAFSSAETEALLAEGGPAEGDQLWQEIAAKLASIGMDDYLEIIGRNLRMLVSSTPHAAR